jgi:hypothetical protein
VTLLSGWWDQHPTAVIPGRRTIFTTISDHMIALHGIVQCRETEPASNLPPARLLTAIGSHERRLWPGDGAAGFREFVASGIG